MIGKRSPVDFLLWLCCLAGGLFVGLMMLHVTADVIAKNLFNHPLPGTIPMVAQFYMVFIVFLPLALVERDSAHIDVEIVESKFPQPVRNVLWVFRLLLGIAVYGLLTWRTLLEAMKKYEIGTFSYEEGVKIPTWPSYFILPIGTSLMVLILVRKLIKKDASPKTANLAAQSEYQT